MLSSLRIDVASRWSGVDEEGMFSGKNSHMFTKHRFSIYTYVLAKAVKT